MSSGVSPEAEVVDRLRLAFLGDVNSAHLRRWVTFFAERGHHVVLLVGTNQSILPGLPASITVERFRPFSARGRFPPASFVRARWSVRRAMARCRPDIVNAHFMNPHGWHAWMSGRHPYVVTLWGSDVFIAPRLHRVVARLGRITLRAADMVMVNSEALRRGAVEIGAPPERIEMVQWGVDLTRFTPGPDPVDYMGIPLSDEGRDRALSYSSSQLSEPERQCLPYGPYYTEFGPFGMAVWSEVDPLNGRVVAWKISAAIDRPGSRTIGSPVRLTASTSAPT